ncbi:MAG TPA: hypothetical protein DIW43_05100, partial [Spongiibacteraceae bacterium]|nr:hypothetical protein [Spongiibacteraceae bacterium]
MTLRWQQLGRYKTISLIAVLLGSLAACASSQSTATSPLDLKRELFRTAVENVKEGRLEEARQAIPLLEDYVLIP